MAVALRELVRAGRARLVRPAAAEAGVQGLSAALGRSAALLALVREYVYLSVASRTGSKREASHDVHSSSTASPAGP